MKTKTVRNVSDTVKLTRARAERETAIAKLRLLDLKERRGELVPVEKVRADWERVILTVRNRLLGLPDELAPRLAVMSNVLECRELIMREVRQALTAMSGSEARLEVLPSAKGRPNGRR